MECLDSIYLKLADPQASYPHTGPETPGSPHRKSIALEEERHEHSGQAPEQCPSPQWVHHLIQRTQVEVAMAMPTLDSKERIAPTMRLDLQPNLSIKGPTSRPNTVVRLPSIP